MSTQTISIYINTVKQSFKKTVNLDFQKNLLLAEFIKGGELSREALKRAYRKMCLEAHPDLNSNANYDFVSLQKDYEEMLDSFEDLTNHLISIRSRTLKYTFSDLKKDFYSTLKEYIVFGLYSPRVKIRPDLKERNEKIVRKLIYLASRYDPSFIEPFNMFNSISIHSFQSQRIERMNKKLKSTFLHGVHLVIDHMRMNEERTKRAALSYLKDIKYMPVPENQLGKSIWELSEWFIKELDK